MVDLIEKRIKALANHFDDNKLLSFDPYDGLNTPVAKLFLEMKLPERIWQQFVKLFPVNLRPLLGIKKNVHTKTVSDLLSSYSILFLKTDDTLYFAKTEKLFSELKDLSLNQKHGAAWGLKFKFTTRFVQADEKTPNLFQTINALNALLDFYEAAQKKNNTEKCRDTEKLINKGINFILSDLGFYESPDIVIWNYWPGLNTAIYNVNALAAAFFSRYKKIFDSDIYNRYIFKTIEYIKRSQNKNGSWNYSSDVRGKFIDGFHTGYILEGLCIAKLNGIEFDDKFFRNGVGFYLENFFSEQFLPKYYHNQIYPLDGQNFAQALQTLFYLNKLNLVERDFISKVFKRTDSELWNGSGYYNYMKTKIFTYKTSMDRWVNAPVFLALSHLY